MFENRQQNLVPLFHIGVPPSSRYEIDRRCCAGGKDDFVVVRRVDEFLDRRSCLLELRGCLFAEPVNPAMHIRVRSTVTVIHCIQNGLRVLGRRSAVKIDELAATMDRLCEDREIGANGDRIEFGLLYGVHDFSLALARSPTIPSITR